VRLRQDRAEQHTHHGQRPLDHGHRHRGHQDADPERRCERQCREPVEHRLEGELFDAAPEAVGKAAEDGEWTDAEQQRRGQPTLDEPFPRGVRRHRRLVLR
jgi:hypothetical protein